LRKKRCAINQRSNSVNIELTNKPKIKAMQPYEQEELIEGKEKKATKLGFGKVADK
jgi:hypothetical protein